MRLLGETPSKRGTSSSCNAYIGSASYDASVRALECRSQTPLARCAAVEFLPYRL